MHAKFMRKKLVIIPIALLLMIITIYSLVSFLVSSQLTSKATDLEDLYKFAGMLERQQTRIDINQYSWWQLPQSFELLQQVNTELAKLPELKAEVTKIETEFEMQYTKFTHFAQTYATQPALTATIAQTTPAIAEIDFQQKRDPQKYIQANYNRLREAVKFINLNTKTVPIKWQYLPDLEVNAMTLAEKVGQLFIWTVKGQQLSAGDQRFLQDFAPGGVILMGENIGNESQVKNLTKSVQQTNPLYSLLISTDQEGSPVKRIGWDATRGQKSMAQLSIGDACAQYRQRDELLNGLGINLNYGIVADITADPKSFIFSRVFSNNPTTASDYVKTAASCALKTLTTVKHFPGHGRTGLDTHNIIASYDLPLAEWQTTDGQVFQTAIDNGVDLVMLGHLNYPQITKGQPASLSPQAVNYLREQMKFNGLIVTDDLGMLSRNKSRNATEDLKSAFKAGNDLLLYVIEPVDRWKARQAVIDVIESQAVSQSELDRRVKNILQVKLALL